MQEAKSDEWGTKSAVGSYNIKVLSQCNVHYYFSISSLVKED